jgi:hypothetical protein
MAAISWVKNEIPADKQCQEKTHEANRSFLPDGLYLCEEH